MGPDDIFLVFWMLSGKPGFSLSSFIFISSVQSLWTVQLGCSMPGFHIQHQLPKLSQTHVYKVGDTIQSSHPLSPPSLPSVNISQHPGLFQWVSSSHQVTKVLEFQLQHQFFQWIFRTGFLYQWLVWSPCNPRDSWVFSSATIWKLKFFSTQLQLWNPYMTTGKTIALTIWTFVSKGMSLLSNRLSRFFTNFLPRSKHLLISWMQSPPTVISESKKISLSLFPLFPLLFAMKWWDQMPCSSVFEWMLSFKPAFSLSSFTFIKRFFSSSLLSTISLLSSAYLRSLIFLPAILFPAFT